MRVNKFGSLLFLKIVHTWPYRVFFKNYCGFCFKNCDCSIGTTANSGSASMYMCIRTRGRRISGFCGGLGGDQETGGKLRAAGRVRIVGKKIFFRSFVSAWVYIVVYRRWYFIFAVAQN
jgi:hypothetical protein